MKTEIIRQIAGHIAPSEPALYLSSCTEAQWYSDVLHALERLTADRDRCRTRIEELEKDVKFHSREALASQRHFDGMLLERQNETERADRYRTALEEILEDRGRYMDSAEIVDRHHEIATAALAKLGIEEER